MNVAYRAASDERVAFQRKTLLEALQQSVKNVRTSPVSVLPNGKQESIADGKSARRESGHNLHSSISNQNSSSKPVGRS
jgi:hypothetical protein